MKAKIIGSIELFVSLFFISFVSCSCDRNLVDDGDGNHYDPRNVSRNEGNSLHPSLAVDNTGNVHLVWADSTSGNYDILYSQRNSDGTWSEPTNLSNTPNDSDIPKIVVDPSSNLHVVWREWEGDRGGIFYMMKPKEDNWTTPVKISTTSDLPELRVDANGNLYAVWMGLIRYRIKPAEGDWMLEEVVFQFGSNPDLAVSKQGDVHVVCNCDVDTFRNENIYYAMKPFGGSWTDYMNISQSHSLSISADIAVDDENRVYIVWTEFQKGMIYLSESSPSGSFLKPDSIPKTRGTPWGADIVVEGDGILYLVWCEMVPESEIQYLKRDSGGLWSDVINVSETSGNSLCQTLVLDSQGSLHIAWQDETPGNYDIFYTVIQTR